MQRFRTLLAQDSIARQEVDTQAALVKQLEAPVMTKAAEGTARLNLGYTRTWRRSPGASACARSTWATWSAARDANGIAVITQISPIDVEFAVPQDQVPELQQQRRALCWR